MFYYINGKLTHLAPGFAVLDVGGVGYRLTVSGTTYNAMPPRSASNPPSVRLYTHLAVREDDIELFGFATEAELSSFRMLISVSGVGPKAAMSVLSFLTPEKFALAVCTDDRKTIAKANGIGPKTAARIILELKDKMLRENGGELPNTLSTLRAEDIAGVTLVYHVGMYDEYYMPYYCFAFVEREPFYTETLPEGFVGLSLYYVPAISGEYLSPSWDGGIN